MAIDFLQLPRNPTEDVRTRRFLDLAGQMLNALVSSGVLVQTGPSTWELTGAVSIGNPVVGADPQKLLRADESGDLDSAENLKYVEPQGILVLTSAGEPAAASLDDDSYSFWIGRANP